MSTRFYIKSNYIKKKYFGYIAFLLIFISCKTKSTITNSINERSYYVNACKSYRVKTDKQITWSSVYISNIKKPFNQVRYCTHNPSVLSQLLYDELGDWDLIYPDEENKSVYIFWFDRKIKGIDKKLNYGLTSYFDCLSSVIVYDENDMDMLASESKYRKILLENFKTRINSYDTNIKSQYREHHRIEITPIYKKFYN